MCSHAHATSDILYCTTVNTMSGRTKTNEHLFAKLDARGKLIMQMTQTLQRDIMKYIDDNRDVIKQEIIACAEVDDGETAAVMREHTDLALLAFAVEWLDDSVQSMQTLHSGLEFSGKIELGWEKANATWLRAGEKYEAMQQQRATSNVN